MEFMRAKVFPRLPATNAARPDRLTQEALSPRSPKRTRSRRGELTFRVRNKLFAVRPRGEPITEAEARRGPRPRPGIRR
jgi:hypothetical protein